MKYNSINDSNYKIKKFKLNNININNCTKQLMKVDDCLVKTNGSDIGIRTFEIYYLCSG